MAGRVAVKRAVSLVLLGLSVSSCEERGGTAREPAARVIERHADSLMAIPGVVGVAETLGPRGETVLQVMLATNDRRVKQRIPRWIEGYRVTFEVTGPIRPM